MFKEPQNEIQFCRYPPKVSDAVDVTEQTEGETTRYIVRNKLNAKYFLLRLPEYLIFKQLDGTQTLSDIAQGGRRQTAPKATVPTLIKFLTRLDSLGLLDGNNPPGISPQSDKTELYRRIKLFNPSRFLNWLERRFGWLLSKPFIILSFLVMGFVLLGLIVRADEFSNYTLYTYKEYGFASIILFTLSITVLHEFAHGWACKHFGGDVEEMGVLMIYYVLPAFYCNVSDIYRLKTKSQRLWVIAAGIYWQLCVSALAAMLWLLATPFSLIADFSFLVLLGGTLNILVNCNPLIKLDGYYALSQALNISNLQTASSHYIHSFIEKFLGNSTAKKFQPTRPLLFFSYWILSILYSILLIYFILNLAGAWLLDNLRFFGAGITLGLAGLLTKRWWIPIARNLQVWFLAFKSASMKGANPMSTEQPFHQSSSVKPGSKTPGARISIKRSTVLKGAFALLIFAILFTPWEASTGSDCTLQLPPGREGIARANTDAVLAEIFVQQGDTIAEGSKIARLANPEIEDKLTQINSEIQRLNANNARIEDELKVKSELLLSANLKETERKRLLEEYQSESQQIRANATEATSLPPSLAILQSEIELKQTELEHNRREVERYKKLFEQGLVGSQIYDRAIAAMRISEKELQSARARLEAAKVDHRRLTASTETGSLVAETEARAARSNFEALIAELHSNRQQLEALKIRQEILQREYDGMNVTAPRAGVVLGEDLQKTTGRHYNKGDEICRIGELEKFLLKIEVSEREISNVRLESSVRFKLKTVPGRTFTGRVSKINAEPIANQNGQRFYPVEVMVENSDGMLRPGMTGFARISFGRQSVGFIIAEKLWHSLRPELWLF
ncbi:MAG: efflux RND transporter periplasmic adaptor subunit [Acidobacteriota bacterium]